MDDILNLPKTGFKTIKSHKIGTDLGKPKENELLVATSQSLFYAFKAVASSNSFSFCHTLFSYLKGGL